VNVVDSSAWLAYFANEKNASYFAPAIEDLDLLVVPSICIYEVFKVILREKNEDLALCCIASMQEGRVVDLDTELALEAATVGMNTGLALADSVIYATANQFQATLWTQDEHFFGKPRVRFKSK
jgi:toxin FitB